MKYIFPIILLPFISLSLFANIYLTENPDLIYETDSSMVQDDKKKNLIRNGDFEEGNKYFSSGLAFTREAVNPGNYSVTKNASKHNLFFASLPDHTTGSGNYLLSDGSPEENKNNWCSKVFVDPQSEYVFSFYAANIHKLFTNPAYIKVTINGQQIGSTINLSDNSHEWTKYTWQWFSGKNNDSIRICIEDEEAIAEGFDYGIDDIVFYKVTKEVPKENCFAMGDTLPETVHFPFDESTITEFSKEKLNHLLTLLHKCPKLKIKILGHTDMYGKDDYNNNLSAQRAKAVFEFLRDKGIRADRMSMEYFGESVLLYKGKSIKDNVKNRRVRFVVGGYLD
jgi:outer membrane protein OmpA-like peptidoglycan-associated protein